ncbi:MAG: hypothetical protein C0397_17085 [Odoribacter sp.]|nr:hypothetical protein [Odoribacter sp.]
MYIENKLVPNHWKHVKLGEYVISVKGKKPKRTSSNKSKDCNIPYVNIKAFEQNIIDEYTDGVNCVLCEEGDFLMVWDGSRSGYVGKAIKGALGSTLVKLNFPNIDNNYAFYFLQSKYIEINTRAKGVGIPHVDPNILWNYNFPIPPLAEQQAIVSKIEELLSDLENGKQQLQLAQQQLKIYRQSLLKWAFEGKLTNKNVKEGELPTGWKIKELIDCAEMCLGKMLDKSKNKGNYQYYLRNISVRWGSFDLEDLEQMRFEESEEVRYGLKKGDLIICEGGEPGRCAIWKDAVSNMKIQKALHRVRVKNELSVNYLFHFMYYSGMSGLLEKYFTGTTIKHLTGTQLKKIEIPLPPIAEQQLIVDELESKLTVCDKIEETISQSLLQAESLRQSILKKAFEGRLI